MSSHFCTAYYYYYADAREIVLVLFWGGSRRRKMPPFKTAQISEITTNDRRVQGFAEPIAQLHGW